jgi:hypothetical protein
MGSDIARVTFDPTRQYRSVVLQQGRVTLEADGNEASRIASEALRLETIDLIGPAATPDDGYKLGLDASGKVVVLPGTMYLGGWRLRLDAPVELDNQPDWLDMPLLQGFGGPTLVALLATEQEVCAVEDQPLREVALGGPDSAARTRLMQHFLRLPLRGSTCDDAAKEIDTLLAADGVTLDPKTFQLLSSARLQVGFVPPVGEPDPCDPPAQGGYLGADNQLIRVTVIDLNPQKGTGTLLWGWNNASFFYRGTPSGPHALSLSPVPVDAEHSPQQNEAIEVLLTQADLGDGNDIAALSGQVVVLTQAYDPDTDLMTLPASFTLPDTNRPLFVRLWQAAVPFTSGTAVALDAVSGLSVTITMTAMPTHIAAKPVWYFAVRPSTPTLVYPQRYLEAPQPPEGPRQWLCDLAVIRSGDGFQLLDDCRNHVGATKCDCCGVTMGPAEVAAAGGLQAALDGLAGSGAPGQLLLRPGIYTLAAPLTLTQKHARLSLEGCGDGVILQADPQNIDAFRGGAILIQSAAGVRLSELVLRLPSVPVTIGNIQVIVTNGVRATASPHLTIEDCTFAFAPGDKTPIGGSAVTASSDCTSLTVRRNRFVCGGNMAETLSTFGVLITAGASDNPTPLDDYDISDNLFAGLGLPVGALGPFGLVRCCDNRVRQCAAGLFLLALVIPTGSVGRTAAADRRMVEATRLPMSPTMLVSVAESVKKAAAQPGGAKTAAAGASDAAATAAAAPVAAAADASIDAILDALDQQIASAVLGGQPLRAVMHVCDNDIELSAAARGSGSNAALVGLELAMIGTEQRPSAALVHGNRVATPASDVAAAAIAMRDTQVVISANLFTQLPLQAQNPVPCVTSSIVGGAFEVMANVITPQATIQPARTPPPTNDWPFLNTIG